ncbi:MAG: acetyl/propionyl/methylcrotonyl-CoA carboxylase subunit alpha [Arenimonas sp.]|nr:acetyl/propionyl/methylcrotonyl-CoA carboxylase subunit alpha [Arenimonas sp.]
MFGKILIANRGEIACRILRSCRRLGIRTVAVYSQADASAQHVRLADEAWPIGGPRPQDSYLRGDAILAAALVSGAQAIHPGYGFLSENADFAEAVQAAGLVFIGPSAASMRKMGSKAGAKQLMQARGVPVVPGYTGEDQDPAHLQREADRVGYPLMIKAAHGGGGKGMRIVHKAEDFQAALESCQREAAGAFGRDRVLIERYLDEPRHIEFQVFGDGHGNLIHLNERECSAQRRYQKVLEESPSPFLTPALRAQMGAAAVAAAQAIDYVNAGTVEFIVGPEGDFYFMEINTRLQVEHPVTELVTGLDLVEWQLRVAAGEALPLRQDQVPRHGHAIEVRLYAEDPAQGFLPGSGRLETLRLPAESAHVRVDAGVVQGDDVSIFYDPMIAKLIVWDRDRAQALARLREALAQCDVVGPRSNVAFLEKLVRHPRIVGGSIHTAYLDRHLDEVLPRDDAQPAALLALAASAALLHDEASTRREAAASGDPQSPWAIADGWRLGHAGARLLCFLHQGQRIERHASGSQGHYRLLGGDGAVQVRDAQLADGVIAAELDGRQHRARVHVDAASVSLHDGEQRLRLERAPAFLLQDQAAQGQGDRLLAPMPGRIVLVKARLGQAVAEGEELLVMEAMKMELSLRAPRDGTVAALQVAAGDFVDAEAVLVRLELP